MDENQLIVVTCPGTTIGMLIGNPVTFRKLERNPEIAATIRPWDRLPHKFRRAIIANTIRDGGQVKVTSGTDAPDGGYLTFVTNCWPVFVAQFVLDVSNPDVAFFPKEATDA